MKTFKTILLIPLVLIALSGCKNDTQKEKDETTPVSQSSVEKTSDSEKQGIAFIKDDGSRPTVLQIAMGSPDHTTLVAAIQAAGLENSLSNAGPLMVFAPTNEAFAALPAGTVENLLKPENKEKLAYILKHHVTPGNYDYEFLKKFKKLGQASNESISVEVIDGEVYVGGAKIIASIPAGNGIVHVVDKVILPAN
jgi:uncharacterized surface protein with fasciclin (FAS1) repeats